MDLEADLIVSAIGQAGDLRGMEELDNGKGLIAADKFYQVPKRQACSPAATSSARTCSPR